MGAMLLTTRSGVLEGKLMWTRGFLNRREGGLQKVFYLNIADLPRAWVPSQF